MSKRKKRTRGAPDRQSSKRTGATTTHPSAGPTRAGGRDAAIDNLLLVLCVAGTLLTAYLSYVAWFGEHALYCSEGSSCDLVQSSRWSWLLGLPMAFWGLLTYLLLAALCWRRRTKGSAWGPALFVAICGVAISTYLTAISVLVIEATCGYCLASFGIIMAILVLIALRRPERNTRFAWASSLGAPLLASVLIVAGLHAHYSGLFDAAAGPEKPSIKALAMHLADSDVKFYGAYWCPRCEEQKALFEASAERLPYVECSPQGRNGPRNGACTIRNIQDFPTWIIGEDRHTGLLGLNELAKYSGFPVPEGGF